MQFYINSLLNRKHLENKLHLHNDGIEIKLKDELFNKGSNYGVESYYNASDVFNLDELSKYPIKVVHAPVTGINLETLMDLDFKLLDQVFYIANFFGEIQNIKVIVVLHSESDMFHLRTLSDTWKRVLNGVGCLLLKYPYTELAIENVSPFEIIGDKLFLRNNFGFDNVVMAKELRKQLYTDRVGTVLDTCHAMMTNLYMSAIGNIITAESFNMESYDMRNYFIENKDIVKLVHLSDIKDDGLFENHGVAFDYKDSNTLTLAKILGNYIKLGYSCPVTLEVYEDDYLACDNYKRTHKTIQDLLSVGLK